MSEEILSSGNGVPEEIPGVKALENLRAIGLIAGSADRLLSWREAGVGEPREVLTDEEYLGESDWGLVARSWGDRALFYSLYPRGETAMKLEKFVGVEYPWPGMGVRGNGEAKEEGKPVGWWRGYPHVAARKSASESRARWSKLWASYGLEIGGRDLYWARRFDGELLGYFWDRLEAGLVGKPEGLGVVTRDISWVDGKARECREGLISGWGLAEFVEVVRRACEGAHGELEFRLQTAVAGRKVTLLARDVPGQTGGEESGEDARRYPLMWELGFRGILRWAATRLGVTPKGRLGSNREGNSVLALRGKGGTREGKAQAYLGEVRGGFLVKKVTRTGSETDLILARVLGSYEARWVGMGDNRAVRGGAGSLESVVRVLVGEMEGFLGAVRKARKGEELSPLETMSIHDNLRRFGCRLVGGDWTDSRAGLGPVSPNWERSWREWITRQSGLNLVPPIEQMLDAEVGKRVERMVGLLTDLVRDLGLVYLEKLGVVLVGAPSSAALVLGGGVVGPRGLGMEASFEGVVGVRLLFEEEVLRREFRHLIREGVRYGMSGTDIGSQANLLETDRGELDVQGGLESLSMVTGSVRRPVYLEVIDTYRGMLPRKERNLVEAEWVKGWEKEFEQRGIPGGFLKGKAVTYVREGAPDLVTNVVGDSRSRLVGETMAEVRMQSALVGAARGYLSGLGFGISKDVKLGEVMGEGISAPVGSPWVFEVSKGAQFSALQAEVSGIFGKKVKAMSPELCCVLRDAILASQLWGYSELLGEGAMSYGFSSSTRNKLRKGWLIWGEYSRMLATGAPRVYDPKRKVVDLDRTPSAGWKKEERAALARALIVPDFFLDEATKPHGEESWYEKGYPATVMVAGIEIPLELIFENGRVPLMMYGTLDEERLGQQGPLDSQGKFVGSGGAYLPGFGGAANQHDRVAFATVLGLLESGYDRHVRSMILGHLMTQNGGRFDPKWLPLLPALGADMGGYYEQVVGLVSTGGQTWGSLFSPWATTHNSMWAMVQWSNLFMGPSRAFKKAPGVLTDVGLVLGWQQQVMDDPYRVVPMDFPGYSATALGQAAMMLSRGLHPLTGESLEVLESRGGTALPPGLASWIWGPFFRGAAVPEPEPGAPRIGVPKGPDGVVETRYFPQLERCSKGLRAMASGFVWG